MSEIKGHADVSRQETDSSPSTASSEDSDEIIAELVRKAGRRPSVPADDAAIVKSAALFEWHRTVRQQRRRKILWRGGGLLAAAAVLWLVLAPLTPRTFFEFGANTRTAATLEAATGPLWSTDAAGGDRRQLRVGEALTEGRILDTSLDSTTTSEPLRALLRLAGGTSLRVDTDSRVRFVTGSQIDLERGAVYADSGPSSEGAAIEIRTAFGVSRDIGTRFEVRVSKQQPLRLRVRDGSVQLTLDTGDEHLASVAKTAAKTPAETAAKTTAEAPVGLAIELTVSAAGEVSRSEVPMHGGEWAWTLELVPRFEVEGQTLDDFLRWAAREGGWRLNYAAPQVAALAADMTLHGSIDGMALEDAAQMTLRGGGLDYHITSDGRLIVGGEPNPGAGAADGVD